jgi:CheY-like chemotaxis protein
MPFILLLEDEPLQVKIVTDILKYQLNLAVKATESLYEALRLAEENPLLIISDIVLIKPTPAEPKYNIDGIKFAKIIKENPQTSHIPFILRSSLSLNELGVSLEDTMADEYISKTIAGEEFVKVVKSYVIE